MSVRLLVGDCRAMLATLPDASAHVVCTSPPYYGLRAYGTNPQVWGGDPACAHSFGEEGRPRVSQAQQDNGPGGGVWNAVSRGTDPSAKRTEFSAPTGAYCTRCAAWRGELGSEPTPEQFVANLVSVFAEVRRVLHPTGVLVLNLGDSYAGSGKGWGGGSISERNNQFEHCGSINSGKVHVGYKAKDLMQMPARVAMALQADGWYLRSVMPWLKRAAMPESVTDRPSNALEWLFLFSRSRSYFWDAEAIRQQATGRTDPTNFWRKGSESQSKTSGLRGDGDRTFEKDGTVGRAFRNTDPWFLSLDAAIAGARTDLARLEAMRATGGVLLDDDGLPLAVDINPAAYKEAHFATYPPALVVPFVKAGTSELGCCPRCLAPWARVVERGALTSEPGYERTERLYAKGVGAPQGPNRGANFFKDGFQPNHGYERSTRGWQPSCACDAGEPRPAVVLDCFAGSGTTLLVADRLGRDALGIELSEVYARMAQARIDGDAPLFEVAEVETAAGDYAPPGLFEGAAS